MRKSVLEDLELRWTTHCQHLKSLRDSPEITSSALQKKDQHRCFENQFENVLSCIQYTYDYTCKVVSRRLQSLMDRAEKAVRDPNIKKDKTSGNTECFLPTIKVENTRSVDGDTKDEWRALHKDLQQMSKDLSDIIDHCFNVRSCAVRMLDDHFSESDNHNKQTSSLSTTTGISEVTEITSNARLKHRLLNRLQSSKVYKPLLLHKLLNRVSWFRDKLWDQIYEECTDGLILSKHHSDKTPRQSSSELELQSANMGSFHSPIPLHKSSLITQSTSDLIDISGEHSKRLRPRDDHNQNGPCKRPTAVFALPMSKQSDSMTDDGREYRGFIQSRPSVGHNAEKRPHSTTPYGGRYKRIISPVRPDSVSISHSSPFSSNKRQRVIRSESEAKKGRSRSRDSSPISIKRKPMCNHRRSGLILPRSSEKAVSWPEPPNYLRSNDETNIQSELEMEELTADELSPNEDEAGNIFELRRSYSMRSFEQECIIMANSEDVSNHTKQNDINANTNGDFGFITPVASTTSIMSSIHDDTHDVDTILHASDHQTNRLRMMKNQSIKKDKRKRKNQKNKNQTTKRNQSLDSAMVVSVGNVDDNNHDSINHDHTTTDVNQNDLTQTTTATVTTEDSGVDGGVGGAGGSSSVGCDRNHHHQTKILPTSQSQSAGVVMDLDHKQMIRSESSMTAVFEFEKKKQYQNMNKHDRHEYQRSSFFVLVLTLSKAIVGSAVLILPSAFNQASIVISLVILAIMCLLSGFTFLTLADLCIITKQYSLIDMWRTVFNSRGHPAIAKYGSWFVEGVNFFNPFLVAVTFCRASSTFVKNLATPVRLTKENMRNIHPILKLLITNDLVRLLVALLPTAFPLCFLSNLSSTPMAIAGGIGTLSVVWLPIAMAVRLSASSSESTNPSCNTDVNRDINWISVSPELLICISISIMSTSAHHNAPRYFQEFLKGRKAKEARYLFKIACCFAFGLALLFYSTCSVLANITFKNEESGVKDNIVDHFRQPKAIDRITVVWFLLNAVATLPHHFFASRRSLYKLYAAIIKEGELNKFFQWIRKKIKKNTQSNEKNETHNNNDDDHDKNTTTVVIEESKQFRQSSSEDIINSVSSTKTNKKKSKIKTKKNKSSNNNQSTTKTKTKKKNSKNHHSSLLCETDYEPSQMVWCVSTILLFLTAVFITIPIPNLTIISTWRASIFNVLLVFIFPSILYLYSTKPMEESDQDHIQVPTQFKRRAVPKLKRSQMKFLLVFGLFASVCGIFSAIVLTFKLKLS